MITRPRKPYSEGLRRRRIVRAIQGDMVKSAAAGLFRVSLSCIKRCMRIVSQGGSLS
jgi:transposase